MIYIILEDTWRLNLIFVILYFKLITLYLADLDWDLHIINHGVSHPELIAINSSKIQFCPSNYAASASYLMKTGQSVISLTCFLSKPTNYFIMSTGFMWKVSGRKKLATILAAANIQKIIITEKPDSIDLSIMS